MSAADLHDPSATYVGVVALNYRLTRKLGEGGFGAVFLAEHVELGRRAACKILHPQFARDPGQVERFFREARAVCEIGHKAIIGIENFGRLPAGEPFYLMEYFAGASLGDLVRDRALEAAELIAIFDPIADALEAAHAKGIIHRDLKPDNIMVATDGRRISDVRLLDFGIAKLLDGHDGVASMSGFPMGTPAYMAPEQALDAKNVDARADVYAFGATVFAAVARRAPFVGASVPALLISVQTDPAPALRSLVPGVPDAVDRSVARCLAKLPADRPRSVAAAWGDMRAALLHRGGTGDPLGGRAAARELSAADAPTVLGATATSVAAPARSRTPLLIAAAGALAVALMVIAIAVSRGGSGRPRVAAGATGPDAAVAVAAVSIDAAAAEAAAPLDATDVDAAADAALDAAPPIDAGARRKPDPPPGQPPTGACTEASFDAVLRAPAPTDDELMAALRRLRGCEGKLDAATYRRIQQKLVARQ